MESVFNTSRCRMALACFFMHLSLLSACTFPNRTLQVNRTPASIRKDGTLDFVHIDETVKASISIEIADTPESQMKGLMGRSTLDGSSGMLFVFDHTEQKTFWMKNTRVPLDIIFVGEDGCIVNIMESTTPMSNQRYRSAGPIKYVVEVHAGFAKRYQLDADTCIRWQRR